jgi:hypothetical protein
MKRKMASILFLLTLTAAFLSSLFVAGPAVLPNVGIAQADDCPDVVCFGNPPEICCLRLCSGQIVHPCFTAF